MANKKPPSNFQELTPKARNAWKAIRLAPPSDARDQRINNIVKPMDRSARSPKHTQN